jgi:hypothetical protein
MPCVPGAGSAGQLCGAGDGGGQRGGDGAIERVVWSDKKLKAGEWKPQLEAAMKGAIACVLLVSDNFLASNFVRTIELPYLLEAYEKRVLMVFWAYLEPCDIKRFPSITRFQAMTLGDLKSMAQMNQWEWKQTMLKGCDMIDEFLKDLEAPIINQKIIGKRFPRGNARSSVESSGSRVIHFTTPSCVWQPPT